MSTSKKVSGKHTRETVASAAALAYARAGDLGGARLCIQAIKTDRFRHIRAAGETFVAGVFPSLPYRPFRVF